jgi:hypothetical protein
VTGAGRFAAGLVLFGKHIVKRFLFLALLLVAIAALGCGGGRDRGKHQDFDRPKATQSK